MLGGQQNAYTRYSIWIISMLLFAANGYCTFSTCKQGREIADKSNTDFNCKHLELMRKCPKYGPVKQFDTSELR